MVSGGALRELHRDPGCLVCGTGAPGTVKRSLPSLPQHRAQRALTLLVLFFKIGKEHVDTMSFIINF